MNELDKVTKKIEDMVKEIGEYLKQKDLAELKSNPAFLSEFTIATIVFVDNEIGFDFIKDLEAIVSKYGFEVVNYSIYPLGGIYAIYIYIGLG
jgi:hypothetical protein